MGKLIIKDTPLPTWKSNSGERIYKILRQNNFYDGDALNDDGVRVVNTTKSILETCVDPKGEPCNSIGLALGYVQSGKTISFTTLIAQALENEFKLIILFSGTKNTLNDQSLNRLKKDLNLSWREKRNIFLKQDFAAKDDHAKLESIHKSWKTNEPEKLIIVIKKHHGSLLKLIKIFKNFNLDRVPTLIIDDEADQASLNTQERKNKIKQTDDASKTFKRINELRDSVPFHSYIQYTATPQSLLLIRNENLLSPNFLKLIEPGEKYTGGWTFFIEKEKELICKIPKSDIPKKDERLAKVPKSLSTALRQFFVAITINELELDEKNMTMMVHPAVEIRQHSAYTKKIKSARSTWVRLLGDDLFPDEKKSFEDEFEKLKETHNTSLKFDEKFIRTLILQMDKTAILTINSGKDNNSNLARTSKVMPIIYLSAAIFWIEG